MFNAKKFLDDYNIQCWTDGKNVTSGWINIQCPWHQDNSNHLGFSPQGALSCWECGGHSITKTIEKLLKVSERESIGIYYKYQVGEPVRPSLQKKSIREVSSINFPPGTGSLLPQHRKYLCNRKFESYQLERDWDLKGTAHIGEFKWRIVIPIYHKHKLVSWQTRDITNKSKLKYINCELEKSIRQHKHCLYGYDKVPNNKIIIVEGVTDVWRLGFGSVATFGIGYTWEQFALMLEFDKCFILFDPEDDAQKRAYELANKLSTFKQDVEILEIDEGDPADLSDKETQEIMKLVR